MANLNTSLALQGLRDMGADRQNPVRFAYLEALARRAEQHPDAVRQTLMAKIERIAQELANRPHPMVDTVSKTPDTCAPTPLQALLHYLDEHAHAAHDPVPLGENQPAPAITPKPLAPTTPELKSVAYFRHTWSKLSAEQQLTQTLAQAPENAGPMNSQHLVLRALQTMRDISPEYLQGFMSYIDTLIWLEQATPLKPPANRAAGSEDSKRPQTSKRAPKKRS